MKKRLLALSLVLITLSSTGCSGIFKGDVTKYPLINATTEQEILDFYAEGLKYDTVITKNLDVQKTEYVEKEITGSKKEKLEELQKNAEATLLSSEYVECNEISEDVFHYIKAYLNGNKLEKGKVSSVTGALGYYFVDVEYVVSDGETGTIKPIANLLGINGAFVKDAYGGDKIDTAFLYSAVSKLNRYYTTNKINKTVEFNEATGELVTFSFDEVKLDKYTQTTPSDRINNIDISTFNKVVGSSYKSVAYMPQLSLVYELPSADDGINGVGMVPSGEAGLKLFEFNRDKLKGSCTLRYVFKDTMDGSGLISGVNVYPKSEKLMSGINVSDKNVNIPEFLIQEFSTLLERADRAEIDNLMSALMGANIYEDMGYAMLRGYEYNHVNLLKNMSTIRQVLARDTKNNAYLLEVESTRIEGAIDVDSYGTYRDKYYIVIQQKGKDFVITDKVRTSRQLIDEPSINPDSSVLKRLVALNLSGDVDKKQQDEIEKLLNKWYIAGTCRILDTSKGAKDAKYRGNKIKVDLGMYNCFNKDVKMISSDKVEYINSSVRGLLTKYGTNIDCDYSGTVTEWIGGYENQAEFTTEELFKYNRKNQAVYQEVYYLVSNMNGEWVIDERTVIAEKNIEGNEINNIYSRINN